MSNSESSSEEEVDIERREIEALKSKLKREHQSLIPEIRIFFGDQLADKAKKFFEFLSRSQMDESTLKTLRKAESDLGDLRRKVDQEKLRLRRIEEASSRPVQETFELTDSSDEEEHAMCDQIQWRNPRRICSIKTRRTLFRWKPPALKKNESPRPSSFTEVLPFFDPSRPPPILQPNQADPCTIQQNGPNVQYFIFANYPAVPLPAAMPNTAPGGMMVPNPYAMNHAMHQNNFSPIQSGANNVRRDPRIGAYNQGASSSGEQRSPHASNTNQYQPYDRQESYSHRSPISPNRPNAAPRSNQHRNSTGEKYVARTYAEHLTRKMSQGSDRGQQRSSRWNSSDERQQPTRRSNQNQSWHNSNKRKNSTGFEDDPRKKPKPVIPTSETGHGSSDLRLRPTRPSDSRSPQVPAGNSRENRLPSYEQKTKMENLRKPSVGRAGLAWKPNPSKNLELKQMANNSTSFKRSQSEMVAQNEPSSAMDAEDEQAQPIVEPAAEQPSISSSVLDPRVTSIARQVEETNSNQPEPAPTNDEILQPEAIKKEPELEVAQCGEDFSEMLLNSMKPKEEPDDDKITDGCETESNSSGTNDETVAGSDDENEVAGSEPLAIVKEEPNNNDEVSKIPQSFLKVRNMQELLSKNSMDDSSQQMSNEHHWDSDSESVDQCPRSPQYDQPPSPEDSEYNCYYDNTEDEMIPYLPAMPPPDMR